MREAYTKRLIEDIRSLSEHVNIMGRDQRLELGDAIIKLSAALADQLDEDIAWNHK